MNQPDGFIELSGKVNGRIDFSVGMPDPETFPIAEIREIASRIDLDALEYVPNAGCNELRKALSSWLLFHWGLNINSENILITNGSMEGIFLTSYVLGRSGDFVISDCPGYWRANEIFQSLNLKVIENGIPMSGFDIGIFESIVHDVYSRGERIAFYYCTPDVQNPMGTVMDADSRKRLVHLAKQFDFLILEDDAKAKLAFDPAATLPLMTLEGGSRVIRTGTFSKFLCPGLRIGWLVGPQKFVSEVAQMKPDGGTNPVASAIALKLVQSLDWRHRFSSLREHYKSKVDAAIMHLSNLPNDEIVFSKPQGGFFIFAELLHSYDWTLFDALCVEFDLILLRGRQLGRSCKESQFRLSLASLDTKEIEEGIGRLWSIAQKSKVTGKL